MKKIDIIDTHCHLNDEKFLGREKEIVNESKKYGVNKMVCIGYDVESSKKAVELANSFEEVYAVVGLHPDFAPEYKDSDIDVIEDLAKNEKVLAIGEIGLDYYWHKDENVHKKQKELLKKQIDLANKLDLPVVIHTREATLDTIEELSKNRVNRNGIMHCTPLNEHLIKETLKLGYYISFSGIVTFKNAKPESSVLLVPEDKILTETDSPYLTPVPFRGKENMPGYTYYVTEKVAEIRNVELEEFSKKVYENVQNIYYKLKK